MTRTVLFYGDSNTYGYDPRGFGGGRYPAESRWTDLLADALAGSWRILPYGQNGRCIPDADMDRHLIDLLLEKLGEKDIFAVMLGTNDIILSMHPDADTAARKMDALLRYICLGKFRGKVLLIAPPAMDRSAMQIPGYRSYVEETEKLSVKYRLLAQQYDTLFCDANEWGIAMSYDHVHIAEEGHRTFAREMGSFLEALKD
ncbi:MAG: lipase [Eubacterium sp.]|nr:lipase [Eubacterium sp.]